MKEKSIKATIEVLLGCKFSQKSFFCFALETAIFYCNKNEIMPHYFDECEIFCISVISLSCNFF